METNSIYRFMSASTLRKLADLTEKQEELQAKIAALTTQENEIKKEMKPRRKMSAKARKAIGLAQKARWAKLKK